MAGHETNLVRPKTAQDTSRIAAGSPLAIQGIFLEILRERFKVGCGLQWEWKADATTTGIFIESSYNEETEARNNSPSVYVTRLQSVPTREVVGDRAGVELKKHQEGFYAKMTVHMRMLCVANDEGESALLGDTVQFTLLASQDGIQEEFGFHDFKHPILGQTEPMERDQRKWVTPVDFSVDFVIRWAQVPIAPLIQQIRSRVSEKGTDAFKDVVLTSMGRDGGS